MSTFHFKIVTPEEEIYNDDVEAVYVTTSQGEIGILPEHVNLMAAIIPGELRVVKGGKNIIMATGSGILQMANNTLQINTDMAENLENIDEKEVLEAQKRAKEAMEQRNSDEEYAIAAASLEKALAKLKVKRRHSHH